MNRTFDLTGIKTMTQFQFSTYVDLSVEASRSHQCRIQDVGSVGSSQDHHVSGRVKTWMKKQTNRKLTPKTSNVWKSRLCLSDRPSPPAAGSGCSPVHSGLQSSLHPSSSPQRRSRRWRGCRERSSSPWRTCPSPVEDRIQSSSPFSLQRHIFSRETGNFS